MDVTHDNFNQLNESVKQDNGRFLVPTYARCTVIDKKCIDKWNNAGLKVLWPDTDGRGFRMASGKKSVYVIAGYLKYQANL